MTAAFLAAGCAVAAAFAALRPRRRRRLPAWLAPARRSRRLPMPAVVTVVLLTVVVVGATGGWMVAAVVLAASVPFARRNTQRADRGASTALAVDLLAGCLGAGATVADALVAAAEAASETDALRLAQVARRLRAGHDAEGAWQSMRADDRWREVAAACVRAGGTGAALAPELRRIAARDRLRRRTATRAAVQRAGVWVVLPLGLCFLPAFVLVGIVPLVLAAVPQGVLH